MRRTFLIVVLALGTVLGYASGFIGTAATGAPGAIATSRRGARRHPQPRDMIRVRP
jgi:hypothetical protein